MIPAQWLYNKARREYMFWLRAEYRETYRAIGARFGISVERARQLCMSEARRQAYRWYHYNGLDLSEARDRTYRMVCGSRKLK